MKILEKDRKNVEDFLQILNNIEYYDEILTDRATTVREESYGKRVFFRALIELSSTCKNDCYYCGLRNSNKDANRYILSDIEIFDSVKNAYDMGFRTVVLQGGENNFDFFEIVKKIRDEFKDLAITLSLGEKSHDIYEKYKKMGANRYLLRHETMDELHYSKLHPKEMSLENRKNCLVNLKKLGYQTGCGMMIGSPYQTMETLAKDLYFIQEFKPEMVGVGPFIPAENTPFENFKAGSTTLTYQILKIIRIINPKVLLPITTALSTLDNRAIENGLNSGANVVMPNLSPLYNRKKYSIYNGKKDYEIEQIENFENLKKRFTELGYVVDMSIGNYGG